VFLYHERLRHSDPAERGVGTSKSPLQGPRQDSALEVSSAMMRIMRTDSTSVSVKA